MNSQGLNEVFKYFESPAFLESVLILAFGLLLMRIIKQYLIKKVAYTSKDEQHRKTFIGVMFNVLQYLVIIITVILILKLNGVNIASILAGLGIAATIIGLALQDTLKDIISGINIYNNNFYKVGDVVRYNNEECMVKYFSAKVTKFQSLKSNSTYTVCNSQITAIEKIKDRNSMIFYFPFAEKKEKIEKVMGRIVERMNDECKAAKMVLYDGICLIDSTGVAHELKYRCQPQKIEVVRDKLASVAYEEFQKAGISPLFNSIYR